MLLGQQQMRSSCPSTSSTTAALLRAAQLGSGNGNNNSSSHDNVYNDGRQTHLTKFAFLLSSARGEGSDEPVVGMHHDVEMAACFSERHNNGGGNNNFNNHWGGNNMMRVTPPSISSSSLSMQSKNGQQQQLSGMPRKKSALMEIAAMNMSTPFYTTPDTVSSTAKTILKNIVTTMEELMDSRLRSTVSQLVNKSGGIANSQLLFRLLSPSRKPIQVATVITRFVIPDPTVENTAAAANMNQSTDEMMLSIPLQFKAILDVKIFGVVSTVELCAPVTMSGNFDPHDGLLAAVDVSFDCVRLLNTMIQQGRAVVKTAVTKAAALSVQIAEWHARKKASSLMRKGQGLLNNYGTAQQSQRSLHSLLGSDVSLNTIGNSLDGGATLTSLFTSFSSVSHSNNKGGVPVKPTKGLLRESSRGLWRSGLRNSNAMRNSQKFDNNANATFEFGGGTNSNMNTLARTASRVQFQIPTTLKNSPHNTPRISSCATNSSSSSPPSHQQAQQQSLQQQQEQEELQSADKGNIHHGLFSWLQDDKMFLTEEKIQEQNAADAERERKLREAPMPLRFFTAAEDLGGGESGLQMVSNSIFGQGASSSSQVRQGVKREHHVQGGHCHQKRRTGGW
mmetsp:Transcript_7661/g.16597  ORF Transcript_7661/g.16597 Transcript_7661/m.16597 type:complete len:620 (+) Transcript_7661:169-2028(+)